MSRAQLSQLRPYPPLGQPLIDRGSITAEQRDHGRREQARCYAALFEFWSAFPRLSGIAIWEIRAADPITPLDTGYGVHRKPAEAIIAAWFRAR